MVSTTEKKERDELTLGKFLVMKIVSDKFEEGAFLA